MSQDKSHNYSPIIQSKLSEPPLFHVPRVQNRPKSSIFVDFWWFSMIFRGFDFSWIFHGFFVDSLWIFRGFFVDSLKTLWIFHGFVGWIYPGFGVDLPGFGVDSLDFLCGGNGRFGFGTLFPPQAESKAQTPCFNSTGANGVSNGVKCRPRALQLNGKT